MNYERNYNLGNVKTLVLLSLFSAIITAMTAIPQVGYITYGVISITTLHVPVIIGSILLGPINGLILGTVWGITCLVKAYMTATPEALIFMNPLISLVPRSIVGWFVGFLSFKVLRVIKNKKIRYSVLGLAGSLCNTVLVLTALSLFGNMALLPMDTVRNIFGVLISLNGIVELFLAIAVVPVVVFALEKSNPGGIIL